jgi:hypothetical protein
LIRRPSNCTLFNTSITISMFWISVKKENPSFTSTLKRHHDLI